MGCNKCNDPEPCVQNDCTCAVKIGTDCITYTGDNLECSGIVKGTILTNLIQQLDAFICDKFTLVGSALSLINIGNGAKVYKGINGAGQKEIRSSVGSFSIDVIENDNDITYQVNEDWLLSQISTSTVPALYINNLYIPNYSDWLSENAAANSNVPVAGYQYKGKGTLSKPFTDTITYTLGSPLVSPVITPNTAIQNGLDGYVGTGTALSPQFSGQKIIIQNNITGYVFSGTFNYSNLMLEIESNVSSTTTGKIVDMNDNSFFDGTNAVLTITIKQGQVLTIVGDGFYNDGNTNSLTNYVNGKTINLLGEGLIYCPSNNTTKYILNSDVSNIGNNNAGNLTFIVHCTVRADYQGVYRIGGKARMDFYGSLISGYSFLAVNPLLQAYFQTGGQARFFQGSEISFGGSTLRNSAIAFNAASSFTPVFIGQGVRFTGAARELFYKVKTDNATLQVTDSQSGYDLTLTEVFVSPNLWSVLFNHNVLASGNIDNLQVDLTQGNTRSVINYIGASVLENLRVFTSKAAAQIAGVKENSAFIKRSVITAGNFVAGQEYKILSIGSTDFTTIGATANTEGLFFTASGVGSGTGTATLSIRQTLN